jgi:GntR family transcriptional regulator, trigonelline degradation regulator
VSSPQNMKVVRVVAPIRQQVTDQIRDAIVQARFRPGQRLVERDLSELTGVSRPTVREALQQLAAEGLVTTVPGRGWNVTLLTVEEVEDLYAVRSVLEGLAGRRFVARASTEAFAELRRAFDEVREAFEAEASMQNMLTAKDGFYRVLFDGAASETVISLIASLHARVSTLRARSLSYPGRPKQSLAELTAIHDAVVARDADAVALACQFHIEQAGKYAVESLRKEAVAQA